jgi:hypothetical protein
VLGNHDHWAGGAEVRRTLIRAGAEVLDNAHTTVTLRGERLQVVGLDDAYTGHADWQRAVHGLRHDLPTLGLSHIAEEADHLWTAGVSLVLSGHTHAGQVTLARLNELALGRIIGHRYIHGIYGSRSEPSPRGAVYVGAGIGAAVIPLRVGERARREVAIFELGYRPRAPSTSTTTSSPPCPAAPPARSSRPSACARSRTSRPDGSARPPASAAASRAEAMLSTVLGAMSLRPCRFGQALALLLACAPEPSRTDPAAPAVSAASRAAAAPQPSAPAEVGAGPTIRERPITLDEARRRRTIAYRQRHQDPAARDVLIEPRMIILHHTGGGDLDATWRYFDRPVIEAGRTSVARGGELNVSAHFLVDRDGAIVRLMPETWMARHCVGLNHLAIGVENVGDGAAQPLTDAQLAADVALVRDLKRRFPGITHLIGHHEYRAFEGHPFYSEREPAERPPQEDPGPAFMRAVRAEVADLELEGPPAAPS